MAVVWGGRSGGSWIISGKLLYLRAKNQTNYIMTTVVYKIKGMMCSHCVMHVQKALDSIPGVKADVTLDPPQARIEFSDKVYGMDELQAVISEKAGEYVLEN